MQAALVLIVLALAAGCSADCDSDVQEYIDGLATLELWALQMFDSSAKIPANGALDATIFIQVGNYDQCIATSGPKDANNEPKFKGKYCIFRPGFQGQQIEMLNETIASSLQIQSLVQQTLRGERFAQPIVVPLLWAVCAPSSCGAEGVKRVADFNLNFFASVLGASANTSVIMDTCYSEGDGTKDFDAGSWAFVAFVAVLVVWICFATAYEYYLGEYQVSGWRICVNAFSLKKTFGDLMKIPEAPVPGQLACVNGIRVGSILWVMLGHTYMIHGSWPLVNYLSGSYELIRQFFAAPLLNAYVAVDTFFLLSGLLTAYVPLMDFNKGRKFSIVKYYVYRYVRITVPYAVVIWYASTLNVLLGHGPTWFFTIALTNRNCKENWWASFLYVTNYFFAGCLGQTWYLNLDMQFALLAPLVLIPLMKWPRYALGAIGVLTLASMAACFGVTYVESLPWALSLKPYAGDTSKFSNLMYQNTPMRAVPYLVGMALGYVLSNKVKVSLKKAAIWVGWFLSTAICLTVIFVILIPNAKGYEYDRLGAAFFAGFHKLGWSLGIAWVIWACVNGHGGPVNKILSWKYLLPLSKLSFSAYLVHQEWMQLHRGLRRTQNYMSHLEAWYIYGGHLICVLPLSMFLHLAVEAPLMILLRTLFKKKITNEMKREALEKEK